MKVSARKTALSESEPNPIATGSHFPIYRLNVHWSPTCPAHGVELLRKGRPLRAVPKSLTRERDCMFLSRIVGSGSTRSAKVHDLIERQ